MKRWHLKLSGFLAGLLLVLTLQAPVWAKDPATKVYCSVEKNLNIPGKTPFKDGVATLTGAFMAIKGVMNAIYVIDKHRMHNQQIADGIAQGAEPVEPLKRFVGPLKAFFLTVIPTIKVANHELRRPQTWWVKLRQKTYGATGSFKISGRGRALTGFDPYFSAYDKFYKAWLALAAAGMTYKAVALGVCKRATIFVPICKRKKKQCSLDVHDEIPSNLNSYDDDASLMSKEGGSCDADQRRVDAYNAQYNRDASSLRQMAAISQKVGKFVATWAPRMQRFKSVFGGLNSALGPVKSSLKGLSSIFKPLAPGVKLLNNLMNKQICIGIKACVRVLKKKKGKIRSSKKCTTKKTCTTPRRMGEQMNKFGGEVKNKLLGAVDALYKPVVNKILKKLPMPNMKPLEKAANTVGSFFSELGKLAKELDDIKKINFSAYTSRLRSMDRGLQNASR